MLDRLKPQPCAHEITDKLIDEGHELYIVTATQSRFVMSKQYWIDKYFPRLKDKLIITNYKSLVSGLDLLIDDQPMNIELFPNETIIMDYAWNQDCKRDCPRAKYWNDVYKVIHELNEKGSIFV
jgi:5'(3')-deoxyribonucleotidase